MQGLQWPSWGELASKAIAPFLLTPVVLVLMPLLLLGQSASRETTIGLCPQSVQPPSIGALDGRRVKLVVDTCAQQAQALRGDALQALINVGDGEDAAPEVLFKASQSRGRESLASARKIAMALRDPAHGFDIWPRAIAVDNTLELSVGVLVVVLPALLIQWLMGAVAPSLVQAVDGSVPGREERLRLHVRVAALAVASVVGYAAGIVLATAIGNHFNGGTAQVIRELDASISATPAYVSDLETTIAFVVMSASFLALIVPALVFLSVASRSRVAFATLYQVLALALILIVMAFGYLYASQPVPYAEYLPLVSAAQGFSALVRAQLTWSALAITLLVNAAVGGLFLYASLRVRTRAARATEATQPSP